MSTTNWTPAGRMRALITIQTIDVTRTASGETTDTPIATLRAWAFISPLAGRETWLAKSQDENVTHRIRMPYQSGITPQMQALWQGRVFRFTSVVNVEEMNRELEILATEALP